MFQSGARLLDTLAKEHLPRTDEKIKAIGWFLVSVGETLERGSLNRARKIAREYGTNYNAPTSMAIGFCLMGDQIMNWSTAMFLRQQKEKQK